MKKKYIIITIIGIIALAFALGIVSYIANTGKAALTNNINPQNTSAPTATPTPAPHFSTSSEPTATPNSPTPTSSATPSPAPTDIPTASPVPTTTPSPTPIPTPSPLPTPDPKSIVFSDAFKSGDTSAWTNTSYSGVNLSVQNSMFQCSTNTPTVNNWGYVYKVLNQSYTSLDWRWYVYFGNLPTTDGNTIGAGGIYNTAIQNNFTPANGVLSLNVIRQNGASYWKVDYVNNAQIYSLNSTSTVSPDTWYLVELKAVQGAGNGEAHFYLNNVETLNATGLTNDSNQGINHVSVGGGITSDQPITWYCASAIASTQYVGPDTTTNAAITSTAQTTGNLMPTYYATNAITPLFLKTDTTAYPIVNTDLMATLITSVALLATGLMLMPNYFKTGINNNPKIRF